MNTLASILDSLAASIDADIQDGLESVSIDPEVAREFLSPVRRRRDAVSGGAQRMVCAGPPPSPAPPAVAEMTAIHVAPKTRPPLTIASAPPVRTPKPAALASALPPLESDEARRCEEAFVNVNTLMHACKACGRHRTRTNAVAGEGRLNAEIMFIGDAPDVDDDAQGRPFAGSAGQLLTRMVKGMGLSREEVYITTAIKCFRPNTAKLDPQEVQTCSTYLNEEITRVRPRVIVALGASATQALLGGSLSALRNSRGKWHAYKGIPVMPTFHPSYLIRVPAVKKDAWNDLKIVLARLGRAVPPRENASPPGPTAT